MLFFTITNVRFTFIIHYVRKVCKGVKYIFLKNNIRFYLKSNKINQKDFSIQAKIGISTLEKILRESSNDMNLTLDTIIKICNCMNITIDDLVFKDLSKEH